MSRLARLFVLSAASSLAVAAQSPDGVWRSEGYGYVFEFSGPTLKAFEVTERTCVPGFTAARENGVAPGREATFRTGDGDVYFIRAAAAGDHRLLHNQGSASDIRIDRLAQRPLICSHPTANTPPDNFEVFTRTWAENYISFDLKHADWNAIVNRNRARVAVNTSPDTLFDVLQGMIQPFGDAHTFISAPELKRRYHGLRPGTDRAIRELVGNGGI